MQAHTVYKKVNGVETVKNFTNEKEANKFFEDNVRQEPFNFRAKGESESYNEYITDFHFRNPLKGKLGNPETDRIFIWSTNSVLK